MTFRVNTIMFSHLVVFCCCCCSQLTGFLGFRQFRDNFRAGSESTGVTDCVLFTKKKRLLLVFWVAVGG